MLRVRSVNFETTTTLNFPKLERPHIFVKIELYTSASANVTIKNVLYFIPKNKDQ